MANLRRVLLETVTGALSAAVVLAVLFFAFDVFAQGAVDAALAYDPSSWASKAFDAFVIEDWWALGTVIVYALTWAIRTGAASERVAIWFPAWGPRVAAFLDIPLVGFALPIVISALPAVATVHLSGTPFTIGIVAKTVVAEAGGAKMILLGWKNYNEQRAQRGRANPPAVIVPPPPPTAPGGSTP